MTQQLLDRDQIRTAIEEVRGKGVAKRVRGQCVIIACRCKEPSYDVLDSSA